MYKMIVVDDEYLVRTGITETIDWNKYDIEIVDTAQNGKVGLEKIELHHPDIIISDIKMPVMNGLQLVEALYERNYDGIIIMLSGYNDFEYAKGTLERGVFKYLLKPIDNDELIDIVVKAREKLKKRRVMDMYISDIHVSIPIIKNKLADDVFHGVSDGEIKQKFALYDMPLLEKGIVIYCKADVSTAGNESESEENVEKALSIIREEIVSLLSNHRMFYSTGQIRVAFATDFVDVDALEKKLTETLRNYEKLSNVVLSIGLSGQFGRFEDIHSAFGTAKFIASNKLYAINSVYIADQAKENLKMYKRHVVDAMQYIAEHYSDNELKIKTVADALYVSESYLMHLFKDELGKTFNTCLTEYRIMMAKRLLLEQKHRVYEIAEMVGYLDMKYFGQVFRRAEGCTPSEYVRKHNEKKS